MLSVLIMDHKLLSQNVIDELTIDMEQHPLDERTQLMDWLMANQLTKAKNIALMESWLDQPYNLQRRIYWYYQGRLRWVGQTPPPNSEELLSLIEKRIVKRSARSTVGNEFYSSANWNISVRISQSLHCHWRRNRFI